MSPRETLTAQPAAGDYVLSPTGFSWNVRRSTGAGAAHCVADGNRDRQTALVTLLSLAEADRADAWETVGNGVFWRIKQFRAA